MSKHKNSIPRSIRRLFPKVKKVIDARHAVNINVTAKDCKNGESLNPSECALAKAAKREFKAEGAIIGLGASYVIKGNKATRFHTPERVRREIVSFDRNHDFAEGNYTLTTKPPSNKLGAQNSYARKDKNDNRDRHDNAPRKHIRNARVRIVNTKNL